MESVCSCFFILNFNNMLSKNLNWRGAFLITLVAIPLGYSLMGAENKNIVAVGEILRAVGLVSLVFGVGSLVVYVWSKVSSKYLEKKEVPSTDDLKDNEALESLFSDVIEEEEGEFAERLTENDTKSGSKDSVL